MNKLIAYHGDRALKERVINELAKHREADQIIKGTYWEDGKGCAVGCVIKCGDYSLYESEFGIPESLARLEDRIFEELENPLSQLWPERFMSAINVGADLSKVHLKFMHWLLTDFQKLKNCDDASVNAAIDQCRTGIANVALLLNRCIHDDVVSGNEWAVAREATWEAAAEATWGAERAAAWAAAEAAWAAAGAAGAAWAAAREATWEAERAAAEAAALAVAREATWEAMADKLIGLIQECKSS